MFINQILLTMAQTVNPWKANLTNGLILSLVGIIWSLALYFLDLTFNVTLGYIFLVIQIVALFLLIKSYRDNFLHGYMTYGQAIGTGVIIVLYCAIIMAIFTYILYAVIDPELTTKKLAFMEEMMLKRGAPEATIEPFMKLQEKWQKPGIQAPVSILGSVFGGTIMCLLIGIFVRKEGNPLIDSTENK
jgi:hypothetical protein